MKRTGKQGQTAALLFLLCTLALLILAGVLAQGRAYHLTLAVDMERISPTITGAEVRTDLDLAEGLQALDMDEDVSLKDLYRDGSPIRVRLDMAERLSGTVQEILYYLGSYDARFGTDTGLIDGTQNFLRLVERAGLLVLFYALLTAASFLIGVVLLLRGRYVGANQLFGLCALELGLLPLAVLAAAEAGAGQLAAILQAAAHYGVGISAGLTLTAVGKAQILFAAAALFTTAGAFFALSSAQRRSR